ncbi:hypothetical protein P8452_17382 [Trifolium repens]|nr:hypothetical protein P8452_17382 [Trifolium repens]
MHEQNNSPLASPLSENNLNFFFRMFFMRLTHFRDTNLMHEQLISVIEASPSHIRTPLLLWSLCPPSLVVSAGNTLSSPRIERCRPTSASSFCR